MKIFFTVQRGYSIKRIFRKQKDVSWIYLAKDYNRLKRLEQELGSGFERVDISKIQNEVADDIRESYIHWCDALNELNGENLQWWFTTISSRNPSESDLFQFACYLELLRRISDRHDRVPEFVVVESPGLAREILMWAKDRGIDARIPSCFLPNLIRVNYCLRFFFGWIKLLVLLILRFIAARLTRVFYRCNNKSGDSVIINTYVHKGDISKDGIFKDRYFPFLYEYLKKSGYSIKVLPVLYGFKFNFFPIFKALRKSTQYFIIPEDYLGVFDYLTATFSYFKFFKQRISLFGFNGFRMENVIKEERITKINSSLAEATLLYRSFIRIGKKEGSCKRVILWYENQALHKAIIAGVRAVFPGARIVGAQLFIHRPNLLNLFPIQSEFKRSFTPDVLFSTSQYQCLVATSFLKSLLCKPVASLCYSYLFDRKMLYETKLCNKQKIVLVILPFDIVEALELIQYVKKALPITNENIKIVIKAHQDYSIQRLKKMDGLDKWPDNFEIYGGLLSGILNKAAVAIVSNSGAIVEAAISGVPIVTIGRQTVLSQDNSWGISQDIFTQCFSPEEMAKAVFKYINASLNQVALNRIEGDKLREKFFTQVNKITLDPFINA